MKPYWTDTIGTREVKLEQRAAEPRTSDIKNPADWLYGAFGGSIGKIAGVTVTPLKALGVATVFACVRVLSNTISSMPLQVLQEEGRGWRVAKDHRLTSVLGLTPNDEMTAVVMLSAVQGNLSLLSDAFMEVMRDSDGDPVGLYPIETRRMDVYRDPRTLKLIYRLNDRGLYFKPSDVCHIKQNSFNGVLGVNTTRTVRDCLALAIALQKNAVDFFGNGSRPSGVLSHPGQLGEDSGKRLKKQFNEQMQDGAYDTILLEEGMTWAKERSENKDSQFIEARDQQNLEICRIFGVPPHKVGISAGAAKSNAEEENLTFSQDVIRPLCVNYEQEFDVKLLTEEERDQGFCIRFDLDALLRTNIKARYDSYAIGRQWGFLSADDCRAKEKLPALPKGQGDVYLQPLNMAGSDYAKDVLMSGGSNKENKGEGSQKKVST